MQISSIATIRQIIPAASPYGMYIVACSRVKTDVTIYTAKVMPLVARVPGKYSRNALQILKHSSLDGSSLSFVGW